MQLSKYSLTLTTYNKNSRHRLFTAESGYLDTTLNTRPVLHEASLQAVIYDRQWNVAQILINVLKIAKL